MCQLSVTSIHFNIIFIGKLVFVKFDVSYTGEQCGQWASLWFFFFLEIHIICFYVITISFLSYNSQSPNRTSITLQQPNGTVLWNANFSFSSEHPEQMPFNAYSPEASVKVNAFCDFFAVWLCTIYLNTNKFNSIIFIGNLALLILECGS